MGLYRALFFVLLIAFATSTLSVASADPISDAIDQYDWTSAVITPNGMVLNISGGRNSPKLKLQFAEGHLIEIRAEFPDSFTQTIRVPGALAQYETQLLNVEKRTGRSLLLKSVMAASQNTAVTRISYNNAALPRFKREIGSPIYVLEQTRDATNSTDFSFFEIRPSAGTALGHSDSRLLLKHAGFEVAAYGLAGYTLTENAIHPGNLFLLDTRGKIWKAIFDPRSTNGRGQITALAGEFTHLESSAENTLFAVTRNNMIVEIDGNGAITEIIEAPSDVVELYRSPVEGLRIVTQKNGILGLISSAKRFVKLAAFPQDVRNSDTPITTARFFDGAAWIVHENTIMRFDLLTERVQKTPLSRLRHQQTGQGSQEFQFLSMDGEKFYVRLGNQIGVLSSPPLGGILDYKILAEDFFSGNIRSFIGDYGLFSHIRALQPRVVDRSGTSRSDLLPAAKKDCEALATAAPNARNEAYEKWAKEQSKTVGGFDKWSEADRRNLYLWSHLSERDTR